VRPPHPATCVQRSSAPPGDPPDTRAPHSATIQPKRAPHPATVVQRKAPHAATSVQRKSAPDEATPPPTERLHEEREAAVQRSKVARGGGGGGGGGKKPPGSSCIWCMSPACVNGSKCKAKGIFGKALDTSRGGRHKNTKKLSKRNVRESEHMLPMQVVKRLFPGARMDDEPAHSISYTMHRAGVSGAGGGISSTGSSHTAKGWAQHLVNQANQHGNAAMIRSVAVDTYNAALMSQQDLDQVLVQIQQVLQGHVDLGRITAAEMGDILNALFARRFG